MRSQQIIIYSAPIPYLPINEASVGPVGSAAPDLAAAGDDPRRMSTSMLVTTPTAGFIELLCGMAAVARRSPRR
jgi:hypothetical protein